MILNSKRCRRVSQIMVLIFASASLILTQSGTALASVPANDNFANATPISAFPFSDSGDLNGTTIESGEPQDCGTQAETIWYSFTPAANTAVSIDVNGSDSSVSVTIYQSAGGGFGGLDHITCTVTPGESFPLGAHAGATYYFQVGSRQAGTAIFQFHVQQIPPPANDNFANATQVGALPFSNTISHPIAATLEPGEPVSCSVGGTQTTGSAWWAFTPTAAGTYSASVGDILGGVSALAAYQGSSLGGLNQIGCAGPRGVLTFHATAGMTYFFQASGPWLERSFNLDFSLSFQLEVTPPPVAFLFFQPSDPSVFDTVQFFNASSDPGEVGFQPAAWDFGDGTTGSGDSPTHRYAADGDYTTTLTVTTLDGRTASASQVVHVRTHDVAITKFAVPTSASAGQTRSITVAVSDKRYPETVQVQLFKGVAGGFELVGTLTQSIPAQKGGTIPFAFSYTFTPGDAAVGKVPFEAIAIIQQLRDAFPADNSALASTIVH